MGTTTFKAGGFGFKAEFSDFGLRRLTFSRVRPPSANPKPAGNELLIRELEEYFSGERRYFTIPLDLEDVTDFEFRVYEKLLLVPYGETVTYGELAKLIGCPKGARAVGQAVGRNPIGIIVPCHRVLAAGGRIGGYGGGPDLKRMLLDLEGITAP